MPLRILVAYATKHGATAEIAEAIADQLRTGGNEVACRLAADVRDIDGYDAVVLGSAVYVRRWRPEARRFVRRHRRALARMPSWAFSSGCVGEKRDPRWEEPPRTIAKLERLGVRAHVAFGGRVPQDPRNFVERAMLRDTPPEFADRRDFDEIRGWADAVTADLATSMMPSAPVMA